jgi:hypothetical protein
VPRARKRKKPAEKRPVTAAQRAADDALREELRKADLKKFDKAVERVIKSAPH